jgi:hypothetical protein
LANCSDAKVGLKSCQSGDFTISIARARISSSILLFDGRPRKPWTTTASPFTFIPASNLRTQRSLIPIFSAANLSVTCPSRARFNQSNQSLSSWLIAIRSIPPAWRLCQEELSTLPE